MFKGLRRGVVLTLWGATLVGGGALAGEGESSGPDKLTSGYLDVGDCKIYYEARESGPAIVLLHDGLLSSVTWDDVWARLATGYHVIRYDRRGYGRSESPTGTYSSVEDLRKLLNHLKVERAVVVGSSSGGALAIDFAIEHPQMVDGLFLIGPILHGMEFSEQFLERARRHNEPMARDDIKAWASNWSQDGFLIAGSNPAARRKIYDQLVFNAEKLKQFDNALEEKLVPPASQRLSEVKTRTVVVVGEADIADVHSHSDAITAGIRGSTGETIKDAGHLIQLEKPQDIVKKIEEFKGR